MQGPARGANAARPGGSREGTPGFEGIKDDGRRHLYHVTVRPEALQELFHAEQKHAVLIILQEMGSAVRMGRSYPALGFGEGDRQERKLWDTYLKAHEEVLTPTCTARAPWYGAPSDRKLFRDIVFSDRIVRELERLRKRYPPLAADLHAVRVW